MKTTSSHQRQAGFTLIELLVVVVIIGILAVIGINNFITSQMKARDSQRKQDLQTIAKALEMYYNDKGQYPDAINNQILDIDWGAESGFTDTEITNGAVYLTKMPMDPGNRSYFYTTDAGGTYYQLYALLENTRDNQIESGGYASTDCGGAAECNYGISSTNTTP